MQLPSLCVPQSTVGMVLCSTCIQYTSSATNFSVKEIFSFVTFQTSLVTTEAFAAPINCPEAEASLGQHWLFLCVWQSCRFIRWPDENEQCDSCVSRRTNVVPGPLLAPTQWWRFQRFMDFAKYWHLTTRIPVLLVFLQSHFELVILIHVQEEIVSSLEKALKW